MPKTRTWLAAAIVALPCIAPAAVSAAIAADAVKIGFVGTFSGPAAAIGSDMRDGFNLGLEHLGRQIAGKPVEVLYEDDTQKPEVGKQKTDKLIESDHVNFLTGYGFSNVLLASLLPAVNSETFIISANAGPSQIAGEQCSPYFFSVSWQGDQAAQATGEYLNQAIFAFYPGAAGAQFLTQYAQSGLKGQIPLYTAFMIDALSPPKIGELALGIVTAGHWAIDLPNAANEKFVSGFRAAYKRDPSFYAAQGYDAANFINSAVVGVKGNLADKDGLRAAMEKADYGSVRGPYRYGNNHFPIQDFYLQETVKKADGSYEIKTVATILKDHQDRYHDKCPMK